MSKQEIRNIEDIRVLDLSDIERQQGGRVFVLNTTRGKERGDVILVAGRMSADGGADTLVIPATWIPVELTTICPQSQLINSNNLRTTVSRGQLRILNAEDCTEFLRNSSEAQAEIKRLSKYEVISALVGGGGTIGDLDTGATIGDLGGPVDSEGMSGAVTSFAQMLEVELNELHAEGKEPDEKFITDACNKFRNLGELTVDEYKHIHSKLRGLMPEVARLAAAAGKKLQGRA